MLARRVVLVLTSHAEQVALVVVQHLAIRARPEQAVAVAAVSSTDDHAAADNRVQARRLFAQPGVGGALLRLAETFRVHGEAGSEHFRQDHQISATRLLQQRGETRPIGLGVMPGQGGLHQGELEVRQLAQIAHSFSAA
ncbi:hypothetical protein D3C81_1390460 [compost metagenome]